ncbi:MAG: RNA polymerase sigma factor [Bacteroidales bacterium]|jgi:RNA polymerase sigma-70 factor (ECF subfamily)|nr:RNA polymerase sigma factor [Bacteroidales bacterium]MBR4817409.1 RNA polymerase sigma factor [Bacteroidales bacterium]
MYDERQLSERCARGEKPACRELYDSYAGRLLALSTRYTGSQDAAEDVLQDSFIKVFSSIGTFRYKGEGSLYAWIRKIVINRSLDWLRVQKRNGTVPIDEARSSSEIEEKDIGPIPEDVLARMVEELPDGYRTVFNLFAIDGYSHREIGRMLGIKEKTSSSQYFRARALLAGKIKEYIRNNG